MSELHAAAADYRRAGLSVFPVNGKKPLTRWKSFTDRLPTESELEKMPWGRATGLALALGPASGRLACRDFDQADAYGSWADDNPWLAGQCPTVKTCRGHHVYFRPTGAAKTINLADGELRAAGAFVVLPPSHHESGTEYRWLNEPCNLIVDAPEVAIEHFLPKETALQSAKKTTFQGGLPLHTMSYVTSDTVVSYVTSQPWKILPTGPGRRNRVLFEIVRRLKALPENQGREPESFEPELRAWHAAVLPRIGTKEFKTTFQDFCRAWALCQKPAGATMAAAIESARVAEPILPNSGKLNGLAVLCRALANNPSREFFLSARDACRYCGFDSPMAALRAFQKLAAMGLIELIRRGTTGFTGRANRYRWTGE